MLYMLFLRSNHFIHTKEYQHGKQKATKEITNISR